MCLRGQKQSPMGENGAENMSKTVRCLLIILLALMLLALPLILPSGNMLTDYQYEWMDMGLFPLFSARAEEEVVALPYDLSGGMTPNPAAYTEDGYEDTSIKVTMEHYEDEKQGFSVRVAYIDVASPTQLRTGVAGRNALDLRINTVVFMANRYNAVLAVSGDYYTNDPESTPFEYRMGTKARRNFNVVRDLLIIDENGDFHIVLSSGSAAQKKEISEIEAEHRIINAFSFGPALVKDGEELQTSYKIYSAHAQDPRVAIGQRGPCSYVVVVCEGRGRKAKGMTHQQLAHFMYEDLGCVQAYNLDGGNTGTMVFGKSVYKADLATSQLRVLNDCIYFATTVDPESWSK